MDITLIQTAAGPVYEAMLDATEAVHRAYCARNDATFWSERGVRRGHHPWQATFNRIEMLHDLAAQGHAGWVMYLDADAVICQPGFDLRRFLGKRQDYALIAGPGGSEGHRWNINAGVFFLNLGHPAGRTMLAQWHGAFHRAVSDELLAATPQPWGGLANGLPFPDDQHLLQMELMRDDRLQAAVLLENPDLINHDRGRFIRQYLRTYGSPEERLEAIREIVDILGNLPADGERA